MMAPSAPQGHLNCRLDQRCTNLALVRLLDMEVVAWDEASYFVQQELDAGAVCGVFSKLR